MNGPDSPLETRQAVPMPEALPSSNGTRSNEAPLFARRRLTVFLTIAFALTWGLWLPAGIMLGAFEGGELAAPAILIPITIGMFFPLIGALVANRICAPEGRIDLGFRPRIGGNVRFYLAAWFAPAAITLLGCVVFFGLNQQLFDPTGAGYIAALESAAQTSGVSLTDSLPFGMDIETLAPTLMTATIVTSLLIAPFINAIPGLGEEVGWRGMLFPTLCELMPTRAAIIVSGIIWGVWHAPIIAMGHNYGMDYPGFPWLGIITMIVACTAMGSCLCYLRIRTVSIWPCALAHGAVNAIANVGIYYCLAGQTPAGPSPLGCIAGIPLIVLGIVCWLKTKDVRA